ncbi:MAG: hypothetical protein CL624_09480 [Arcobacter sp.]|nr:hypothetical protein [Arcobacter sp.]|tara:strand:- start:30681 stop:31034 length:354 start_codon:yes stop_codon:yes gene_type:complete
MRILKNTLITQAVCEAFNHDTNEGKDYLLFDGNKFGILISTGYEMLPVEFEILDIQLMKKALINLEEIDISSTNSTIKDNRFSFDEDLAIIINSNIITIEDDDLLAFFWNDISSLFI